MAKITFKQPKFPSIQAISRWIHAAALYFKQRLGKSAKHDRLLEPHLAFPGSMEKPTVIATDAVEIAPDEFSDNSGKSLSATKSNQWSLELLHQIEGRQFEELVAAYFREETFRTETSQVGSGEGMDIQLYQKGRQEVFAIVQCVDSHGQKVGVRPVRELLGTLIHERAPRGIIVTTADFTQEAVDYAKQHPIILLTGELRFKDILSYSDDGKSRLLNVATAGGINGVDVASVVVPVEDLNLVNVVPELASEPAVDVVAEVASNSIDFPIQESNTNNTAPVAAKDAVTEESPVIVKVETDVEADTLDFPVLELPASDPETKPAEFFSVSKL